jgi:hypothetical protein
MRCVFAVAVLVACCAPAGGLGDCGRVAVLVKGETFKVNSHQHGRETGAAGREHQRLASLSQHLFAVLPLLWDVGCSRVDVFLDTYARADGLDALLARWYAPQGGGEAVVKLHAPHEGFDLRSSKTDADQGVLAPDSPYEGALFLRPDLILKPLFGAALAVANRSKLLFSFREWRNQDGYPEYPGVPRVADMVMWAPRWAFAMVRADPPGFINNHDAAWVANQRGSILVPGGLNVSLGDISFLLLTEQYDADPAKSGNPLYMLAMRPEMPPVRPAMKDVFEQSSFEQLLSLQAG